MVRKSMDVLASRQNDPPRIRCPLQPLSVTPITKSHDS
jgi:hypothetical protein